MGLEDDDEEEYRPIDNESTGTTLDDHDADASIILGEDNSYIVLKDDDDQASVIVLDEDEQEASTVGSGASDLADSDASDFADISPSDQVAILDSMEEYVLEEVFSFLRNIRTECMDLCHPRPQWDTIVAARTSRTFPMDQSIS